MPLSLEELRRIAAQTGISLSGYWDKSQSAIEAHIQQVLRGMGLISIAEVLRSRRHVYEIPTTRIIEPTAPQPLRGSPFLMSEATWRDILHWVEEDTRPTSMEPQAPADPWFQEHWTVEASRRAQQQVDGEIFQMLARQEEAREALALRQASLEYVGPFTVRSELAVLPADPADSPVQGWRMQEVAGETVINPAVAIVNPSATNQIRGRRVQVPLFEIASNPTIRLDGLRSRAFDLYDRVPGTTRAAREHALPIWEAFMASKKSIAKTSLNDAPQGTDFSL